MSLKEMFFRFLNGQTSIKDFEQWIYSSHETISAEFNEEFALSLVSLNFRRSGAAHDLDKILFTRITKDEFERWRMIFLMDDIILKTERASEAIISAYDLYCSGYSFLKEIGLTYGLCLVVPSFFQKDSWQDLSRDEKKILTDKMYPAVAEEAKRIRGRLLEESIVPHGIPNDSSYYEFTIKEPIGSKEN